jgi:hypothetical protein
MPYKEVALQVRVDKGHDPKKIMERIEYLEDLHLGSEGGLPCQEFHKTTLLIESTHKRIEKQKARP